MKRVAASDAAFYMNPAILRMLRLRTQAKGYSVKGQVPGVRQFHSNVHSRLLTTWVAPSVVGKKSSVQHSGWYSHSWGMHRKGTRID